MTPELDKVDGEDFAIFEVEVWRFIAWLQVCIKQSAYPASSIQGTAYHSTPHWNTDLQSREYSNFMD